MRADGGTMVEAYALDGVLFFVWLFLGQFHFLPTDILDTVFWEWLKWGIQ
jgi:hypothetical protein